MTVSGEGKAPAETDIYKLSEKHGIKEKDAGRIVEQVSDAVNRFQTHVLTASASNPPGIKLMPSSKVILKD